MASSPFKTNAHPYGSDQLTRFAHAASREAASEWVGSRCLAPSETLEWVLDDKALGPGPAGDSNTGF
jgi:hypothetical protein